VEMELDLGEMAEPGGDVDFGKLLCARGHASSLVRIESGVSHSGGRP
jgi:hypothetical protein